MLSVGIPGEFLRSPDVKFYPDLLNQHLLPWGPGICSHQSFQGNPDVQIRLKAAMFSRAPVFLQNISMEREATHHEPNPTAYICLSRTHGPI